MRTVLFLVRKEYLQIFRDRAMVFQIFFIPVVQLLVLAHAATFEIRDTRVHFVDLDRSAASRELADRLQGSGRFHVVERSASHAAAEEDLRAGDVSMIVGVPADYATSLARARPAGVQLVVNAEEGSSAAIVQGYAAGILADLGREAAGPSATQPPLDVRSRRWFSPELNYQHYMVPGILVSLVTIIGTLLTAQNIAREKEIGTLEQLNATPITRWQFVAGKLLPFWILAFVDLGIGLAIAFLIFDVPMRGSLFLVLFAAAVYLVVALGIGLWISAVAETQQQAQFVTFFVMMIYLLMSGLFTPVQSMPEWAQWLAELNPVKHFVVIMRAVLIKGAGIEAVQAPLLILAASGAIVVSLAMRQYSKTA